MQISIRLKDDNVQDKELMEFLDDKPKTWVIKQALILYMKTYNNAMSGNIAVAPTEQNKEDDKKEALNIEF